MLLSEIALYDVLHYNRDCVPTFIPVGGGGRGWVGGGGGARGAGFQLAQALLQTNFIRAFVTLFAEPTLACIYGNAKPYL